MFSKSFAARLEAVPFQNLFLKLLKTSSPALRARDLRAARQLRQIELRQHVCLGSRQNSHAPHALFQGLSTGLQLGQHAAADDRTSGQVSVLLGAQPRNHGSLLVLHPSEVSQKDECIRVAGSGAGGSHLVGVDVVVFAVGAERQRTEDGNTSLLPDRFQPGRIDKTNLADKSQVATFNVLLASAEALAICAAKADCGRSSQLDRSNYLLVDDTAENHQGNVPSLGVGNAQAVYELALFSQPVQQARQCAAAAVNDGHVVTIL